MNATETAFPHFSASYSPEDNKLRLRSVSRLDPDLYKRVRAAGFIWAPKQDLFVAPMWTPERVDLLIELCGDIDDEDTSLVERAEERADRFEDYRDARAEDAASAHKAVAAIADGIPMGQPILVGHHSEKHARKDAERIQNGMRRAVKMWETAEYWKRRAAGAIRHAKYKELPTVRHRRIKGLEADKRKQEREVAESEKFAMFWRAEGLTVERATKIANFDHVSLPPVEGQIYGTSLWSALSDGQITAEAAATLALSRHESRVTHAQRWISHLENRLAYERAMLDEGGGLKADEFPIEVGGRVLIRRNTWLIVKAINRVGGAISSVSVLGHYAGTVSIEEITDYRAPEEGDAEKVKAKTKLAPIVNYPGEGFVHMTKTEWEKWTRATDSARLDRRAATAEYGAHRQREKFAGGGSWKTVDVFLTDAKLVERPKLETVEPVTFKPVLSEPVARSVRTEETKVAPFDVEALKGQLKAGVKVVVVDQLFATPDLLAERVIQEAQIGPNHSVLEPSVGTGQLVKAVLQAGGKLPTMVEINFELAKLSMARCADFLTLTDLGTFDRIVMNPPFSNGQDIAHVTHAFGMLAPGGRLVAIMSAGVKFRSDRKTKAFREMVDANGGTISDLPEDSFASSGTNVRTVLVVLNRG